VSLQSSEAFGGLLHGGCGPNDCPIADVEQRVELDGRVNDALTSHRRTAPAHIRCSAILRTGHDASRRTSWPTPARRFHQRWVGVFDALLQAAGGEGAGVSRAPGFDCLIDLISM
jgi:hypothetical protein